MNEFQKREIIDNYSELTIDQLQDEKARVVDLMANGEIFDADMVELDEKLGLIERSQLIKLAHQNNYGVD